MSGDQNKVKDAFNFEKFNKKLLNAKSSKNLFKAKNILKSCNETLNKQPPNFNPELKSQVISLIEANNQKIKETTKEILMEIEKVEESFSSKDFFKIPTKLEEIKSKIQETGISELLNKVKSITKKNEKSIQAQRNLERYEIPVPPDIELEELELKFYSLNKILKDIQKENLVHPDIRSKIEEVYKIYEKSMEEHGLTDTKKSLGKNLKLKAKVLSESHNISKINKKFDGFLASAKNSIDLLKAKEFMEQAETILNGNESTLIYQDKKEEFLKFFENLNLKLKKWKEDTDSTVKNSEDLMEKFNFSEARKNLNKLNADLKKYGLKNLVQLVNMKIIICNANEQIYNEIKVIKEIFESKSYFKAHIKLESLKQMISTKFSSVEMIKSIKEQINTLIDQINEARNKEEAKTKEDVEKIWINLTETLNFDKCKEDLNKKRDFAQENGYPKIISLIDNYLNEFNLNNQILNLYNELVHSMEKSKYNYVRAEVEVANSHFSETPEKYFSKIKEKFSNLEKDLKNQIDSEKAKIIEQIENIEKVLDEKNDQAQIQSIVEDINNRINETELNEFRDLLGPITKKIEMNKEVIKEQKQIREKVAQKLLKIAEQDYTNLLEKINSALKKTPKIYSSSLKLDLENELDKIKSEIADNISQLRNEFDKLNEKIGKTTEFSEIQNILKNYKERAIKLGLDDLVQEIDELDRKCNKNTEFFEEYKKLSANYDGLIDFIQTINAIYKLDESSESEKDLFDHIKSKINELTKRVKSDSVKRETKVKNAFNKIIKNEVMALKFSKAIDSLTQHLTTAKNLNVTSIIPEIQQYLDFCSKNLPTLQKLENITTQFSTGKIIEARKDLAAIIPTLPKNEKNVKKIADLIISRSEKMHDTIENEIEKQIDNIKKDIPRLVSLVEDKKTAAAKSALLTARARAQYLGIGMTVAEIDDLLKICELQSTSGDNEKRKKKKNKKTEQSVVKATNVERTMIIDQSKPEPLNIPASDQRRSPDIETSKTSTRIQPRSTMRTSNQKSIKVCPYCKATQPTDHEKFCFFCGKQLK
ncbi:MAG: hypothetical protein DRO88_08300 [Promethearchaeia archaeon]|nr:MAG: hypothetical protein DRO88_08300 [Candidatus Lokiarchaeia archaeon]